MRNIHCRIGRRTTGKSADLALAVDDFLVRQNGAEVRAPIHRNFRDIGEPHAVGIVAADRFEIGSALFVSGLNQEL